MIFLKISCGCSTSRCQSKQCKCHKAGLHCTTNCKRCANFGCTNRDSNISETIAEIDTHDDEDVADWQGHREESNDSEDNDNDDNCEQIPGDNNEKNSRSAAPTYFTRWASSYESDDDFTEIPFDSF